MPKVFRRLVSRELVVTSLKNLVTCLSVLVRGAILLPTAGVGFPCHLTLATSFQTQAGPQAQSCERFLIPFSKCLPQHPLESEEHSSQVRQTCSQQEKTLCLFGTFNIYC